MNFIFERKIHPHRGERKSYHLIYKIEIEKQEEEKILALIKAICNGMINVNEIKVAFISDDASRVEPLYYESYEKLLMDKDRVRYAYADTISVFSEVSSVFFDLLRMKLNIVSKISMEHAERLSENIDVSAR